MKNSLIIILVFLSNCLIAQTELDSLELLIHQKEGIDKVKLLTKISYKYWNISPEKGISYAEIALEESIKNNYTREESMCYNCLGVNYWAKGEFEIALSFYYKSLEIGEKLKDGDLISACLNNIAMIYSRLKQYDKAIEYYIKAEDIAISRENIADQIKYNNNIGNVFMRTKKYKKALSYFQTNMDLSEQLDDPYLIALSNTNIGLSNLRQNNLEEALYYLNIGFDMFMELSNLYYTSTIAQSLGVIYLKQQKYPQALKFLTQAEKFATESNSLENLSRIQNDISEYYVAINDYKTAFLYQNKKQIINDSLFNKKNTEQIAEMHTKYESAKKETENILLRKQNEINTILRNSFIGLSVLVILLIVILYSRFYVKKKANRALSQKNKLIEEQKKELALKNDRLIDQYEKVKLLNSTKDKFFTIISHDLKSPFNSILGFTNLLVEEYNEFDDIQKREIISSLNKSSQHAYELLENLLTWARTQTGNIKINKELLNLKELVETSITPYKNIAAQKNIEIAISVPPTIKFSLDRNTTMTIIGNLVNNAIKFTPEGGIITINILENKDNIELHIIDTGVGMTSEIIGKLFKIDEDISTKGTNNEKGTGLGLILCKEFIEKNGGNISVISELGKGSEFIITLYK